VELGVLWRSLRQRWYLVLALAALAGSATYLVYDRVGPTYEATGTSLVFPPSQTPGPTGDTSQGNPYLTLGGVNQARDVLVRALTSKAVGDEFGQRFPGTTFEVVPDYTNSAPIILFTIEAKTPGDAVAALQDLMGRVPVELDALQEGLDLGEQEKVTSVALTQDQSPTTTHKAQLRGAILVAAMLIGAGLLMIALVDGILSGGRRRRQQADDAPETDLTVTPAPTPPPTENRPEKPLPERTRPAARERGRGRPPGTNPGNIPSKGPSKGPAGKAGGGRGDVPAEVVTTSLAQRLRPAGTRGDSS